MLKQTPPLSLYIHMPWCIQKCPYCDFNSHSIEQNSIPEQAYIQRLLFDLEQHLPMVWGRTIQSVFIGGGTPSLFSSDSIAQLLSGIRTRLLLSPLAEISLEANPNSADRDKFAGFRQAGINRLSLGIQSFSNQKLKALGRVHDSQQAIDAIEAAQATFENFNIDLMFALPEQSGEQALLDLKTACQFKPPHLSWYQLTLEPNTWFYQHPPTLPTDDHAWQIQTAGQHYLQQQGYQNYEISAYHRQQQPTCQHNLNYWQFGDYLAIGAGAHGKITDVNHNTIYRYQTKRHPQSYLTTDISPDYKAITSKDLPLDFMLNALRLTNGVPLSYFQQRTGLSLEKIQLTLLSAQAKGWLKPSQTQLQPTRKGLQFLNELLQLFL